MVAGSGISIRFCVATLIVEIADDFVVATGEGVAVETRDRDIEVVAEAVADSILTVASGVTETVVIDAPATVSGAGALAAAIAKRLPRTGAMTVMVVDDIRLRRIVGELKSNDGRSPSRIGRELRRRSDGH